MHTVLIIVHLLIAMALIAVVLLQRSEGGALGIGGGGGSGAGFGGMFSPRGSASTLTRTTAILGFAFLITSLALTWVSLGTRQPSSLFDAGTPGAVGAPPTLPSAGPPTLPSAAPAAPAAVPEAPAAPPTPPQDAAPVAPAEPPAN